MNQQNNIAENFGHRFILPGITGLILGVILTSSLNWTACTQAQKASPETSKQTINADIESPFTAVATKAGPAVVNIQSKKYIESPAYGFQGPFDDFFKEFLGDIPQR
jgi:S1-C subfamily serine protease